MLKYALMIAAVGGLSACGGGSNGGGQSFDAMAKVADELSEQLAGASPTTAGDMPTSGSATYNGVAALESGYGPVLAAVKMNATFGAAGGEVSGEMTNFRTETDKATGSVVIEKAAFVNGSGFRNNLTGKLTAGDEGGDVTGTLMGEFVGDGAEGIRGTANFDAGDANFSGSVGAVKK